MAKARNSNFVKFILKNLYNINIFCIFAYNLKSK